MTAALMACCRRQEGRAAWVGCSWGAGWAVADWTLGWTHSLAAHPQKTPCTSKASCRCWMTPAAAAAAQAPRRLLVLVAAMQQAVLPAGRARSSRTSRRSSSSSSAGSSASHNSGRRSSGRPAVDATAQDLGASRHLVVVLMGPAAVPVAAGITPHPSTKLPTAVPAAASTARCLPCGLLACLPPPPAACLPAPAVLAAPPQQGRAWAALRCASSSSS